MAVSSTAEVGIEYTVRRSDRARRVRVTVHPHAGVEVVLPRRAPERAAAQAVVELRPWIERRLAEVRAAGERVAARGGALPYLGESLRLVPEQGRTRAHRRGAVLLVPAQAPAAAVERWYRRRARAEIEPRLQRACALSGLHHTGLDIREQRTRWASCSAKGRMSFNWRLLLAPDQVLEYVVWHEVCHLEVHDHSPRFWGLVQRRWPTWREDRAWLREHGATLVLGL